MGFRPWIAKASEDALCSFLAREATRRIDEAALKGETVERPLSKTLSDLWDREREVRATGRRDVEIDHGFKVLVLPFEGRVYGLVITEQWKWRKHLLEQDWVEEFGYWDHTDPPDGMPEHEWDERSRIWDGIMSQDPLDRLGGCGFHFEFLQASTVPNVDQILPSVPGVEGRASMLARSSVINAASARLKEQFPAEFERNPIHYVLKAGNYTETEEGEREVAREAARIQGILPEITREALLGW